MGFLVPRRNDLFAPLQAEFDRFFDEFFKDRRTFVTHLKSSSSFPKMDVLTQDGEFIVRMAVSGMKKEDINIHVTNSGEVTVEGRMSTEYVPKDEADLHVKELRTSAFKRCFKIPEEIVEDGLGPAAKLEDGILTLSWVYDADDAVVEEPRKIEIKD